MMLPKLPVKEKRSSCLASLRPEKLQKQAEVAIHLHGMTNCKAMEEVLEENHQKTCEATMEEIAFTEVGLTRQQ